MLSKMKRRFFFYRICPTEVVVCPTGMALSFPLSSIMRMVAEEARLPRVSPTGPINCPGVPKKSRMKPVAMMVPINSACPVSTVSGFFNQAARPSRWARMATLKGKKNQRRHGHSDKLKILRRPVSVV